MVDTFVGSWRRAPLLVLIGTSMMVGCELNGTSARRQTGQSSDQVSNGRIEASDIVSHVVRMRDPSAGLDLGQGVYVILRHDHGWRILVLQDSTAFLEFADRTRIPLWLAQGRLSDDLRSLYSSVGVQPLAGITSRPAELNLILAQLPAALGRAMQADSGTTRRTNASEAARALLASGTTMLLGETVDHERVKVELQLTEHGRVYLRKSLPKT
jgi:hypothetical protein